MISKSVIIVQEPIKVEAGDYEKIRTIIAIPVAAMLDDASRIQVKDRRHDTIQTMILSISIRNHDLCIYLRRR